MLLVVLKLLLLVLVLLELLLLEVYLLLHHLLLPQVHFGLVRRLGRSLNLYVTMSMGYIGRGVVTRTVALALALAPARPALALALFVLNSRALFAHDRSRGATLSRRLLIHGRIQFAEQLIRSGDPSK